MIRINLLPVELRRGNRLSTRVLATAFASAIAMSGCLGWFGLTWFGDLTAAEETLANVEHKLGVLAKDVAYHDQLESNRKDYAERVQTIQQIGQSRRLWSRFCDDLIDLVNNNGDTERHLAWFGGIQVKDDPKKGATVTMPGAVQGEDSSKVANFHEDLEAAPFAADLLTKSDPTWRRDIDKNRMPQQSLSFPLVLTFQPRAAEPPKGGKAAAKNQKQAAAAPAK